MRKIGNYKLTPGKKQIDVFWSKVNKTDNCWEWTGATYPTGYGVANCYSRGLVAHRLSWIITNGNIPEGKFICHHCDNRLCVRPDHLFLGNYLLNRRDADSKGRMPKGELVWNAKLNWDIVKNMRRNYIRGVTSYAVLSRKYGIDKSAIHSVISGKTWYDKDYFYTPPKPLTQCIKGHPYTKEHTYFHAGKRYCKSCRRDRVREYYRNNYSKNARSLKVIP